MDHEYDSAKAAWLTANLKPGEQYAGLVLGLNGDADYHLVIMGIHRKVTLQKARVRAASLGGTVPSAREMMMVYLNLPGLFSSHEHYWTNEDCPAPSYVSEAEAKRDYVYAGRPSEIVPGPNRPGHVFVPYPITHGNTGLTKLTAVLVRRIPLAKGQPEDRTDVLAILQKLDSRLAGIGFKPVYSSRPLTQQMLAQNTSLHWVRISNEQRFELSLEELDEPDALSVPGWQRKVSWNVHAGLARWPVSPHTGKQGKGMLDEKMIDHIVATLEKLLTTSK